MSKSVMAAAAVAVLGISSLAMADIINGDFSSYTARSDGTLAPAGWSVNLEPTDDLSLASQTILASQSGNSDVLRLRAANTFTWVSDGEYEYWQLDQAGYSVSEVYQLFINAPADTVGLRFRAAAWGVSGSEWAGARVMATVLYANTLDGQPGILSILDADWNTPRYIPMPNLDASQTVQIRLFATSENVGDEPNNETGHMEIALTADFDDFAFVTPEPTTMLLLSVGLVGLLRRRR